MALLTLGHDDGYAIVAAVYVYAMSGDAECPEIALTAILPLPGGETGVIR